MVLVVLSGVIHNCQCALVELGEFTRLYVGCVRERIDDIATSARDLLVITLENLSRLAKVVVHRVR